MTSIEASGEQKDGRLTRGMLESCGCRGGGVDVARAVLRAAELSAEQPAGNEVFIQGDEQDGAGACWGKVVGKREVAGVIAACAAEARAVDAVLYCYSDAASPAAPGVSAKELGHGPSASLLLEAR